MNDKNTIPPLDYAYDGFSGQNQRQALIQFAQQISTPFPEILDNDRDKAIAKIHSNKIEEQAKLIKQDSQTLLNALQGLLKLGELRQDDRMVCALLDYIDEIIELTSPKQCNFALNYA